MERSSVEDQRADAEAPANSCDGHTPQDPGVDEASLAEMPIEALRAAIRENRVSFPSQVPAFAKYDRADLQPKLVQLYFVFGWSCHKIGERYGYCRARIWQILSTWRRRAVKAGYIQSIPADPVVAHSSAQRIASSIHVVLSQVPAISQAPAQSLGLSGLARIHAAGESDATRPFRPRRKLTPAQIVVLLKQLEAGRTLSDLAREVGVSNHTVAAWRASYGHLGRESEEVRRLRQENAELMRLLTDLGFGKDPLIYSIRKSYGVSA